MTVIQLINVFKYIQIMQVITVMHFMKILQSMIEKANVTHGVPDRPGASMGDSHAWLLILPHEVAMDYL